MPVVNVNSLTFKRGMITAGDFTASRDNATSLSSGTVGEVGQFEVFEDGQFSKYEAVQVGAPATSAGGDKDGNEVFVSLADDTGTAVADTAEFQLAGRQKGELGGGAGAPQTPWMDQRDADASDVRQRPSLFPTRPIKAGALVTMLCKDETASLTVDITNASTTVKVPFLGGQ